MSISTVPRHTRIVELLGSQDQWKSFLEVAAHKKLNSQEENASNFAQYFIRKTRVCQAHCQCALAHYLTMRHGDSWDNISAFSYIGVSKLSCSACRIWLEAFNGVGQQKIYTRGCHGKWYWPWGMPSAEESLEDILALEFSGEIFPRKSLAETMAGEISREYIRYLKEGNIYRSSSDSTDASMSGGKPHLSNHRMELVHSRLSPISQEPDIIVNPPRESVVSRVNAAKRKIEAKVERKIFDSLAKHGYDC